MAQWYRIAIAAQRLWVRFPGNTHTDKKNICITWIGKSLWIKVFDKCIHVNKTNKKKKSLWIVGLLESMFIYCICTQYLVGAPFALITASTRHGMEVISLWHCWGGMEAQVSLTVAFSSSAFFGLLYLIFLLTISHRFSLGFRSGEFAGQSSTPTPWSFNQLLVLLTVWAGA